MIVIADSNIFYSALITPKGVIASILAEKRKIQFIAPDYMIDEVKEHYDEIMRETGKNQKETDKEFKKLVEDITILKVSDISKDNFIKAYNIVKEVDVDDTPFVVLHLQTGHKIWTGDSKLKKRMVKKGYAHCFIATDELKKELYKAKK